MVSRNKLLTVPPFPVEQALKGLGANLRTARVRRKLTIQDVADKIGTGPRAVMDAERGKPSTGIVVYAALLWVYDLLESFGELADPSKDREGLSLEASREPARVRKSRGLDNDF
jgi:transcriptional regulator with XRE-family HTH domain